MALAVAAVAVHVAVIVHNHAEVLWCFHIGLPITCVVEERRNFLTADECDAIRALAEQRGLEPSLVHTDRDNKSDERRVSSQVWLGDTDDPMLADIAARVAAWTGLPTIHQEAMQVVKYELGGRYEPHWDGCLGNAESCERMDGAAGARLNTVLMYLNDDFAGGHTWFPFKRRSIVPEKGKAVLFYNVDNTTHKLLLDAMHGGDPVLSGNKWIATKWTRIRPFKY